MIAKEPATWRNKTRRWVQYLASKQPAGLVAGWDERVREGATMCYKMLQVLPLVPRDSFFVFVLLHHLSELAMRRMLPSRNCSKMSRRLLNSNAQQQLRRTSPRKGSLIDKDRWSLFSSMELVALALTKENEFARAQSSAFCLLLRDFDHPYSKCFATDGKVCNDESRKVYVFKLSAFDNILILPIILTHRVAPNDG